ncbi:MAG: hypothetical protein ACOX1N_04440 [Candidatus Methanomethylophilaceae archaeon]|jgi:hypothetical protein
MDNVIIVYDSEAARKKYASDYNRFKDSMDALLKKGFKVEYVDCKSAADVKGDGEAQELVEEEGFDVLPIAEFMGAIITSGEYVSNQDLVDFLEVPDGVIDAVRSKPPPLYETGPPLDCSQTDVPK